MIPPLHLVTDDEILQRPSFLKEAAGVLEVGGPDLALHLRGPGTAGRRLHSLAEALRDLASSTGGTLLVNDRVDVALTLDLPGVHLGQRSFPPDVARGLLGPHRLLGLSVHNSREAAEGSEDLLDFLMVGTIFRSASHPGVAPGGLGRILEIREVSDLPLLAIGGVTPGRVKELLTIAVDGVAVRGGIWDAPDPKEAVRGYLEVLEGGKSR